jgi:hypothetical protein
MNPYSLAVFVGGFMEPKESVLSLIAKHYPRLNLDMKFMSKSDAEIYCMETIEDKEVPGNCLHDVDVYIMFHGSKTDTAFYLGNT